MSKYYLKNIVFLKKRKIYESNLLKSQPKLEQELERQDFQKSKQAQNNRAEAKSN